MWLVLSSIVAILLGITFQDIKNRAVYALWFPALIVLFIVGHFFKNQNVEIIIQSVLLNLGFLTVQLLMLTAYFSIRSKSLLNITKSKIGWGDILFLFSIAFYLSILNFLLFYVLSLVVVLLIWLPWQFASRSNDKHIPLAGLQAVQLMVLLIADTFNQTIDLTSDTWLLHYFTLWN